MNEAGRALSRARRALGLAAVVLLGASTTSCWSEEAQPSGPSTFKVTVTKVNGSAKLPSRDKPLPANRGDHDDLWEFTVEAVTSNGEHEDFDGVVRLSAVPGAVLNVAGEHAKGRNLQIIKGYGQGVATVTASYGEARLWIEDIGYVPAAPGKVPACSDGKDNDGDGAIDFPADPGCAYADDDTETGGTHAAGVSEPVEYALPTLVDLQGQGAETPYPFEAVTVNATAPHTLVVTRVSSDGFYVTDLNDQAVGYNHLYAFNFSTPADMRVCDVVTYLSGTMNEFFGFTELSFPSYELSFPILGKQPCLVPDPAVLDPGTIADDVAMEKVESGLVRLLSCPCSRGACDHACDVKGKPVDNGIVWKMPEKFGPGVVVNNAPTADASSCDLNGDGQVDYTAPDEGGCQTACEADPTCSEWTTFSARNELKVHAADPKTGQPTGAVIQVNLGTATLYDPTAHKGDELTAVTGTLRNFSGGSLNWTVETRCGDDLVCATKDCVAETQPTSTACVSLRTIDDNDQGTN